MSNKQQQHVDRATAVPKKAMVKTQAKIDGAHDQASASKGSPGWSTAPQDVQSTAADWSKAADDLDANGKAIQAKLLELEALRANEPVLLRRWSAKKRAFFSAVNNYADGSKDVITGLACNVLVHQPLPLSGVPQDLRDTHSKVRGTASAAWETMNGKREFMVQCATDKTNPATFSDPVFVSKASIKLTGETPGTTLQVRVLTLDSRLPGGKSQYTDWVPVVVGV